MKSPLQLPPRTLRSLCNILCPKKVIFYKKSHKLRNDILKTSFSETAALQMSFFSWKSSNKTWHHLRKLPQEDKKYSISFSALLLLASFLFVNNIFFYGFLVLFSYVVLHIDIDKTTLLNFVFVGVHRMEHNWDGFMYLMAWLCNYVL